MNVSFHKYQNIQEPPANNTPNTNVPYSIQNLPIQSSMNIDIEAFQSPGSNVYSIANFDSKKNNANYNNADTYSLNYFSDINQNQHVTTTVDLGNQGHFKSGFSRMETGVAMDGKVIILFSFIYINRTLV